MPKPSDLTYLGKIISVHGVKGEVKIKSETADPLAIGDYGPLSDKTGSKSFDISAKRNKNNVVIASIEGITTREAAEALRNTELYIAADKLPAPEEGEYYIKDLIGLEARLLNGEPMGIVHALHNFGAGDIIEIALKDTGKTEMYPFDDETVPEIHQEDGYLLFQPPEIIEAKSGS